MFTIGFAPDLPGSYNVYRAGSRRPVASYFTSREAAQRWIEAQA